MRSSPPHNSVIHSMWSIWRIWIGSTASWKLQFITKCYEPVVDGRFPYIGQRYSLTWADILPYSKSLPFFMHVSMHCDEMLTCGTAGGRSPAGAAKQQAASLWNSLVWSRHCYVCVYYVSLKDDVPSKERINATHSCVIYTVTWMRTHMQDHWRHLSMSNRAGYSYHVQQKFLLCYAMLCVLILSILHFEYIVLSIETEYLQTLTCMFS